VPHQERHAVSPADSPKQEPDEEQEKCGQQQVGTEAGEELAPVKAQRVEYERFHRSELLSTGEGEWLPSPPEAGRKPAGNIAQSSLAVSRNPRRVSLVGRFTRPRCSERTCLSRLPRRPPPRAAPRRARESCSRSLRGLRRRSPRRRIWPASGRSVPASGPG